MTSGLSVTGIGRHAFVDIYKEVTLKVLSWCISNFNTFTGERKKALISSGRRVDRIAEEGDRVAIWNFQNVK